MTDSLERPDPDALLAAISARKKRRGGRLFLFLGMAPGVGKTYAMLLAAHEAKKRGIDLVIGVVETHGREETQVLLNGLDILPRQKIEYRGIVLEEMDLDAILHRKPKLVIVDELAHTNVPGSRHKKRWQDVFELLDAGIDVLSTVNIQHIESRKETVERITGVSVREMVPDSVIDRAHEIRLIDLSPPDLLKRLKEGKVYLGERANLAAANFFKEDKLTALREIALRLLAEKVDFDLQTLSAERESGGPITVAERLMVVVGHSLYSEQLIRATRRLASSLDTSWIAIHVDAGEHRSEEEKNQLARNLELARSLGAEVVTVTDTNIVEALSRVARQRNVMQIVIGRPKKRWLQNLLEGGSLLERLLRKRDLDVYVLRQELPAEPKKKQGIFANFEARSPLSAYIKTLWSILGISLINALFVSVIGYRAVGFVFLLGVLGLSLFVSFGPLLFSAALTALIWDFFFIPPVGTFYIRETEDIFMCVVYVITAMATGILAGRIKRYQNILALRESRSRMLYEIVWDIATSPNKDAMITAVVTRLSHFLDGNCDVALIKKDKNLRPFSADRLKVSKQDREMGVAQWALDNNKPAGWSTNTLSGAEAFYIPLKGSLDTVGVLAYQPKSKNALASEDADLLFTVARQIAVFLEREFLREKVIESRRLEEMERVQRTILGFISEEVRIPLSIIVQAAAILAGDSAGIEPARRKELSNHLQDATEKLSFVIDNLLTMSRIAVGIFPLKKELCDLGRLIQLASDHLQRTLSHHTVKVLADSNLPKVQVDIRLCQHVLANLLMNAAIYSPHGSTITITVHEVEDSMQIAVSNEGPGIPEEELNRIFDKFYRIPGTKAEGAGLGLAVAKGIVKAHGGKISAANQPEGGACFTVTLPK